jgi:hypothetical protein
MQRGQVVCVAIASALSCSLGECRGTSALHPGVLHCGLLVNSLLGVRTEGLRSYNCVIQHHMLLASARPDCAYDMAELPGY